MQDHQKKSDEATTEEAIADKIPTDQHPDWHPFAVWKSQIRSEQLSATGSYPAIESAKIADA